MSLNVFLPDQSLLRPKITVLGVGGAGGNAINNMIQSNLHGVNFIAANTDAQALEYSLSEKKIQLGISLTKGLGAGSLPEIGKGAAEESISEIMEEISDSNMLFITAGMGGGTGTGAAPVIAKIAKENKILTVGVVTKPFHFEGAHRMKIADFGLEELQKYVDTLIIIPNQNLFRIANEKTTFADAFKLADTVLHTGVRGITDLMVMPGLINLDFADIRVVMSEMGKAMMGTGEADGENRAMAAAEAAISNPLLDNISMKGAKGILINITGGLDMTLFEVDAAANRIKEEVDNNANIIFGSTFNENSEGKIRVSVLATGIDSEEEFLQNKKQIDQQSVAHNNNNIDFINNYLSNDRKDNFIPDHNIAYYKPVDPEDTNIIDSLTSEKKEEKPQKNIFNRMSEAIRSHKSPNFQNYSKNDLWSEETFNVPTFLRKK
ncbi:cell division protein FtsZ [Candidatus Neoehrlichia lotoris str. RAC413]|uniref:Cell division protein FtsZ n=1 Tax=Candidatus Neoehrlichia procyonis str. RAC413 TaxID=1359163 RepID=A0A0F3NR68_9RICK|nr:cell division protein FtsZ [Candidatus Neoehrlichia lotoris]KJV69404.1 cell division protein FtsZ [Candidatus Neoehrlichia lotoris str. RAC413]